MAYSNSNPETFLRYRGVEVAHTYKYDDEPFDTSGNDNDGWDNQIYHYWFQVGGVQFDVRSVPKSLWPAVDGDGFAFWKTVMRRAIDAGIDLGGLDL